jgi:hypothetical protein
VLTYLILLEEKKNGNNSNQVCEIPSLSATEIWSKKDDKGCRGKVDIDVKLEGSKVFGHAERKEK